MPMALGSNRQSDRAAPRSGTARRTTVARSNHPAPAAVMEFTIPSVLSATRDVHKAIMDAVERCKYDEQSVFAIRLALEEALVNAAKHGNKLDPKKTVHVEAKVSGKSTEIVIEDQGKGFDRSSVPDPCCTENLLKCSGRGILLMEAYMDKVQYTRGGRRLRMVKKNAK
jgi:serine/threonine-protein kinase RsbW